MKQAIEHVLFELIDRSITAIAALMLTVMAFIISGNALARYLFNSPIPGSNSLVELYLLPGVVVLSLSYVHNVDGNVNLDIISRRFTEKTKALVHATGDLFMFVIVLLLLYRFLLIAIELTLRTGGTVARYPRYISLWIITIGLIMFSITLLNKFYQNIRVVV